MTADRSKEIAKEARRQEESCLYTSTSLYIWLRQVRLQKRLFVVLPLILGAFAGFSVLQDFLNPIVIAILAFLASLFPALSDALKIQTSVDEIAKSAADFKALQDRFRQLANIWAYSDQDGADQMLKDLTDKMDVARSNSITPSERYFEKAKAKIAAGDYDFSVDE